MVDQIHLNAGPGLLPRIDKHLRQLAPHMMEREGIVLLREARDALLCDQHDVEIERLRAEVARLKQSIRQD